MVRLPSKFSQSLNIDPNIEYDAMIRMPLRRATSIFHLLSLQKTKYVSISVKDNGGMKQVSFIKDRGDPNVILDRGGDGASTDEDVSIICDEEAYRYQICCSHNADHGQRREEATTIKMSREVSLCLCMTCLHAQIYQVNINYPDATQVAVYLGPGQNNVVLCRVPRQASSRILPFRAPFAKHTYHSKWLRNRVRVRSLLWELKCLLGIEAAGFFVDAVAVAAVRAAAARVLIEGGPRNDPEEDGGREGERS